MGECCYERALDIARAQGARQLELRAANALTRLWLDQNRHARARNLLAPRYESFSEGFDTGDLMEAKGLLVNLE
jgi:predicted ATPase